MSRTDLEQAIEATASAETERQRFFHYYDGRHRLNFASIKFRNKFGQRLQTLVDNHCSAVVQAPVSRLEIVNFYDESGGITSEDFWAIWKASGMPAAQKDLYRQAFIAGVGYVSVWPPDGRRARFYVEDSRTIAEVYDDAENLLFIAKRWIGRDGKTQFLNLYYPDRIERFIARAPESVTFEPRPEEPVISNPFGVIPFFKIALPSERSFLHDVIPLQDALNKQFCDLMVAGEYNSVRQRYVTGLQLEIDEETQKPVVPFQFDEQLWATNAETAKFGEFSDTALEQFISAKRDVREEIAFVTGIPMHYLTPSTNSFPSGEALRRAEARFISLLQEMQLRFSTGIGTAMRFAALISQTVPVAVGQQLANSEPVDIEWQDVAPISQTEMLEQALLKQQLGFPLTKILEDLGYNENEIAAILRDKASQDLAALATAQAQFDAGLAFPDATDAAN